MKYTKSHLEKYLSKYQIGIKLLKMKGRVSP